MTAKNKKIKIGPIIRTVIGIITLVLSIYCMIVIHKLDMLPSKIFTLFIVIYVVLNILNIIGLLVKKKALNIIAIILSVIMIIASILGIIHGNKIANFMNTAFNNDGIRITAYNVVVLKSSEYKELKDLEEKTLAYTIVDEKYEEYMKTIGKEVKVYFKSFDDIITLYDNLQKKNVDGIVLTDGFIQLLEDEYEDFEDKIKVIYNFEIEEKTEPEPVEEEFELKPVNILISGSDSRTGKIVDKSRSDVNMIVTINPKTHKVLLTSIPRDYYVQVHGKKGNKDKLTHSGIWGTNVTKQTIEDLFEIKIDYTIKVGFQSVIKVVDIVGGVDVYSDTAFRSHCGDGGSECKNIVKGMNHLTGPQALSYARERYAYRNGDHHRIQNQQQVLEAVINKISNNKSLLLKYDKIMDSLKNSYKTNIPSVLIKLIVKEQIDEMPSWKIEKQQVTGGGYMRETLTAPGKKRSVVIPDMDSVKKATNKIEKMMGEE